MTPLILLAVSAVIFLILDALMLTFVIKPLFQTHLGDTMMDGLRIVPAVLFYAGYVCGLTYLVSWPALRDGTALQIIMPAAIIGAMAYGTYELTSYTIMKAWFFPRPDQPPPPRYPWRAKHHTLPQAAHPPPGRQSIGARIECWTVCSWGGG